MKKLTYRITLLEPLFARALGGEPNSGVSLPYVPGGLVRTALLLKHKSKFDVGVDDDLRRRFFDGNTQFCNALPVIDGQPVAPTPLSWQQKKGKNDKGFDFLFGEPEWKTASNCRVVKKPFYIKDDSGISFISPERTLAVHNRRQRDFGRPVERQLLDDPENDDPGIIFRYEALAPRQIFQGDIVGNEDDLMFIAALLNKEIYLGGSRSGGYGRAKIEHLGEIVDVVFAPPAKAEYRITFLSDALLRDANGQYSTTCDTILKHLREKLGTGVKLTCENAFLGQNIVGGFNRKWGLPLAQCVAVAMGSTLKLKIESATSETVVKLSELIQCGIGERRAEGFGRLNIEAVDPLSQAELTVEKMNDAPDKVDAPAPTTLGSEAETVAKQILERHFRNRLDAQLLFLTPKIKVRGRSLTGSQVARLRNVVQQQITSKQPDLEKLDKIESFISKAEARQSIKTKFESATIEGQGSLKWVKSLLDKHEKNSWQEIFDPDEERITSLGDFAYDPADNKWFRIEFMLRYIDLTLAKLAKAVQKKETGGGQ